MPLARWLALLILLLTAPALAETPCSSLSTEERGQYNDNISKAIKASQTEDYTAAIDALLQAYEICKEDPKFELRIAQWNAKLGDCQKALFWYDVVMNHELDGRFDTLIQDARKEAQLDLMKVEDTCKAAATLSVDCIDEGVTLRLGEQPPTACPATFSAEAGTYTLEASKPDSPLYATQIEIVDGANRVTIPTLVGGSASAHLRFRCEPNEGPIRLEYPNGTFRELGCPVDQPIEPGDYTLISPEGQRIPLALAAGETYEGATTKGGADSRSYGMTIAGAVLIAAGLGTAGVGVFFHLDALDAADRADGLAKPVAGLDEDDRKTQYDNANQEFDDKFLIAVISYSVAGLLVAGGATLMILDLTSSDTEEDTMNSTLTPLLLEGGGGVSWTLQF